MRRMEGIFLIFIFFLRVVIFLFFLLVVIVVYVVVRKEIELVLRRLF